MIYVDIYLQIPGVFSRFYAAAGCFFRFVGVEGEVVGMDLLAKKNRRRCRNNEYEFPQAIL